MFALCSFIGDTVKWVTKISDVCNYLRDFSKAFDSAEARFSVQQNCRQPAL